MIQFNFVPLILSVVSFAFITQTSIIAFWLKDFINKTNKSANEQKEVLHELQITITKIAIDTDNLKTGYSLNIGNMQSDILRNRTDIEKINQQLAVLNERFKNSIGI